MAADFNPLDSSSRQKVLNIINQLGDAGLSEEDIMRAFGLTRDIGRQNLQDYYNTAGAAIGAQFEPQFLEARNTLGANPLLADSGYANRLNRQILTDLGARMADSYGGRAADEASRQTDYLRDLYNQRFGYKTSLGQAAYQTMTGLPSKKSTWDKIREGAGQVAGAVTGGFFGGGQGDASPMAAPAPSGAYTPQYAPTQRPAQYGPRRSMYKPWGDY